LENCDSARQRRKTNGHNDRVNPIIARAYGQCPAAACPLVDNFHLCQVSCARNIFTPFDAPTIRRINHNSRKKRPALSARWTRGSRWQRDARRLEKSAKDIIRSLIADGNSSNYLLIADARSCLAKSGRMPIKRRNKEWHARQNKAKRRKEK